MRCPNHVLSIFMRLCLHPVFWDVLGGHKGHSALLRQEQGREAQLQTPLWESMGHGTLVVGTCNFWPRKLCRDEEQFRVRLFDPQSVNWTLKWGLSDIPRECSFCAIRVCHNARQKLEIRFEVRIWMICLVPQNLQSFQVSSLLCVCFPFLSLIPALYWSAFSAHHSPTTFPYSQRSSGPASVRIVPQPEHHRSRPNRQKSGQSGTEGDPLRICGTHFALIFF